jgi:hypothetical protein
MQTSDEYEENSPTLLRLPDHLIRKILVHVPYRCAHSESRPMRKNWSCVLRTCKKLHEIGKIVFDPTIRDNTPMRWSIRNHKYECIFSIVEHPKFTVYPWMIAEALGYNDPFSALFLLSCSTPQNCKFLSIIERSVKSNCTRRTWSTYRNHIRIFCDPFNRRPVGFDIDQSFLRSAPFRKRERKMSDRLVL